MCFTKEFNTRKEAVNASKKPLIARHNYVVYKRVNKTTWGFLSEFRCFEYEKGFLYEETKLEKIIETPNFYNKQYHLQIHRGLHAYLNKRYINSYGYLVIVSLIIPKGAKYWLNYDTNEIVTNKLWLPDIPISKIPNLKTFKQNKK